MGYIRYKPFKQRDGWHYWGNFKSGSPTPEIVGPFETEAEAQKHANENRN